MKLNLIPIIARLYKEAGVIQVPDSVLQDGIAWAKSVYCKNLVLPKIEQERGNIQRREATSRILNQMAGSPLLRAIKSAGKGAKGANNIFKILSSGKGDIIIHQFDADAYDGPNIGTYNIQTAPALEVYLEAQEVQGENAGEVYDLHLEINHGVYNVKIDRKEIDKAEVLIVLEQYLPDIQDIVYYFEDFVPQFTPYENSFKKELALLDAVCKRHIKPEYKNPYRLTIPLKDISYFSEEDIKHFMKRQDGEEGENEVQIACRFVFSQEHQQQIHSSENWVGLWNGNLYLYKGINDPISIKDDFSDMEGTMRHELQHMVQQFIGESKKAIIPAGLPGKKYRTPGFDEYGRPAAKNSPLVDPNERLPHHLRDIEFYTNLTDKLDQYKNIISRVPLQLRSEYFRTYVAQASVDDFAMKLKEFLIANNRTGYNDQLMFVVLRQGNNFFGKLKGLPKYEKAVKVLYAELEKLGLV